MNVTGTKNQVRLELDWADLEPFAMAYNGEMISDDRTYFAGMTWEDALESAFVSYKNAPAIPIITIPSVQVTSDDMAYDQYDVTGEILDVASYLTGLPEYWIALTPTHTNQGRVIRIAVELGAHGNTEAVKLENRGLAIVSLIESLELQGYSLELTIVRASHKRNGDIIAMTLPLKKAGEPLNANRVQFVIGHPAFYRRILMAIADSYGFNPNVTLPINFDVPCDVQLAWDNGLYKTASQAYRWAETTAKTLQDKLEGKRQ